MPGAVPCSPRKDACGSVVLSRWDGEEKLTGVPAESRVRILESDPAPRAKSESKCKGAPHGRIHGPPELPGC
ncbi:hypothetical protein ACFPRL_29310 [Pseudoclavibacter helvolus]